MFLRWQVSWDQCASHAVLNQWVERALGDASLSGIFEGDDDDGGSVEARRRQFVHQAMNEIDTAYGRTLGCRIDPVLREHVKGDNHMFRREQVEAFLKRKADRQQKAMMASEAAEAQTSFS